MADPTVTTDAVEGATGPADAALSSVLEAIVEVFAR